MMGNQSHSHRSPQTCLPETLAESAQETLPQNAASHLASFPYAPPPAAAPYPLALPPQMLSGRAGIIVLSDAPFPDAAETIPPPFLRAQRDSSAHTPFASSQESSLTGGAHSSLASPPDSSFTENYFSLHDYPDETSLDSGETDAFPAVAAAATVKVSSNPVQQESQRQPPELQDASADDAVDQVIQTVLSDEQLFHMCTSSSPLPLL
jgi:hypothetical protein